MHRSDSLPRLLAALALAATPWVSAHAAPPTYRVVEMPFFGYPGDTQVSTAAVGINRQGGVLMQHNSAWGSGPFLCDRQGACDAVPALFVPHRASMSGHGINNAGHVAATSPDVAYSTHAILWRGEGAPERIYGLADDYCGGCDNDSHAAALNNHDQVVGTAWGGDGRARAFIWKDGTTHELGTLGGGQSAAWGINDHGHVVGSAANAAGVMRAFLYRGGRMQDIGTLGGDASEAYAINDLGEVVGLAQTADGSWSGFRYSRSAGMRPLPGVGSGSAGRAVAINKAGQAVGGAVAADGTAYAYYHDADGPVDLNTRIHGQAARRWHIVQAYAINERGDIAAQAVGRADGLRRAVVLKVRAPAEAPVSPAGR